MQRKAYIHIVQAVFNVKTKVYLTLFIVFVVLTFAGAGYVFLNRGTANAGYACVPMLFALLFAGAYRSSKKK